MNVFYSTEILGGKIVLRDQEAQHCTKVLRKGRGEEIYVVDGRGHRYTCEIEDQERSSTTLVIKSTEYRNQDENQPHLAFGLIKNTSRLEWLLEKVTEIGVNRITPLLCKRSERSSWKHDRLQKIVISAMKQSLQYHLPILDEPMSVDQYLASQKLKNRYIASFGEGVPEFNKIEDRCQSPVIMIGPEGDFTPDELTLAVDRGYQRVNLGPTRLRAETACMLGCAIARG